MAKAVKDSDRAAVVPDGLGSLGDAVGIAAGETPCEVMGKSPIRRHKFFVRQTDEVILRVFLCNAPALAIVSISDDMGNKQDLANQQIPPPNPLTVPVMPPARTPGSYVLIWSLFPPPGTDWQMVVEVSVNGTTIFRKYRGAKSDLPIPRGFLAMEVQ